MSILDITCKNSVSFSKDCCDINICNKILLLGGSHHYMSCLYFDCPTYSSTKDLKCAKLILFKQPMSKYKNFYSKCNCDNDGSQYSVAPLIEFFSTYSRLYCVPKADCNMQMKFDDDANLCYTEVDITEIVKSWVSDGMENRGLMLIGNDCNKPIGYASEKNDNANMRPIIRLIYKENSNCCGLSSTPCVVDVKSL